MAIRETVADMVLNESAEIAESPVWDHRHEMLVWADISKNVIWRSDISNGSSEKHVLRQPVGCVALHQETGYVIAGGNGFYSIESFGDEPSLVATVFDDERHQINDGKVDSQGRFWAGSACSGTNQALGSLFCLDIDRSGKAVFGDVTASNGFDWSPDGRYFYYVDTATGGIDVFDVTDSGELLRRRRFIDIPATSGLADGLTVDIDGCVWLAVWYAGVVYRFAPTGQLLERVSVPVCRTSSCAFGGTDMRTLFITTAKNTEKSRHPTEALAGAIFAIETQTSGQVRPGYLG